MTRTAAPAMIAKRFQKFHQRMPLPCASTSEKPAIAIDNTFLGPLWAKPLAQGADLSVYSLTKYVGGHSDLVAGGLVGEKDLINRIRMIRNTIGTICDPNTAWMLLRSLETLELRMSRAGENAAKVYDFLKSHPKVAWVNYPGLEDSPYFDTAKKQFGARFGGILTFGTGDREKSFQVIDALKLAKNLANIGDAKTLVIHPASTICADYGAEEKELMGVTEDLVRVSVGIESIDDIIGDFDKALSGL